MFSEYFNLLNQLDDNAYELKEELSENEYDKLLENIGETRNTILEMAEVGRWKSLIIKIYGSEGYVPHFHFYDVQTKRQGCLMLERPAYFMHGKYRDRLDRKEVIELQQWLEQPNEELPTHSNYHVLCITWNLNNSKHKFTAPSDIPDYTASVNTSK